MEIRPAGAEFFRADGQPVRQTDGRTNTHDEAKNCFSQFRERACKLYIFFYFYVNYVYKQIHWLMCI